MAAIPVGALDLTGDAKAFQAATASDTFANDGKTFLYVKNASGSGITVTVASVTPCNQGTTHNLTFTVAATTGDEIVGPFDVNRFGVTCTVTYSATTSVTVAAFRPTLI
jgi:hypothetical protein